MASKIAVLFVVLLFFFPKEEDRCPDYYTSPTKSLWLLAFLPEAVSGCTRHLQWPGSRCMQHPLLAAMTVVVMSSVKVCLELRGKTGSFKGLSLTEHATLPFPLCCHDVLELGPRPCSPSWFSYRKRSKSPRLFQPTSLF